ncbi:hypothetical protein JCM19239_3957 [Vibrio variabilis]|uniref:Sulfotransferase domain-containing protein n=1 Tax=Vibrio variabilis TaxID=990271 RepID=A0ABQ0J662_9VIBR|nr:hypothetical protein JCM19239_3957 [Vibrio variabilis]
MVVIKKNVGLYILDESHVTSSMKEDANRIYAHYGLVSLSSRVVDKYPEMVFRTSYVRDIFPDAKFLFLYRNGWDTCHSIDLWSKRLGVETRGECHDWWGANDRKWHALCKQVVACDEDLSPFLDQIQEYSDHVHRAAVEWIVTMKKGLELVERNLAMGVKYEDFVVSKDYRNKVLEFCNLSTDENFDSYCESVLKAPSKKKSVKLPSEIASVFNEVMKKLGYEK